MLGPVAKHACMTQEASPHAGGGRHVCFSARHSWQAFCNNTGK